MPFYDYECEKCGEFEEFAKIADRNTIMCPECSVQATLLISATSVKGDPTTIGALADKNTKKMGRYEIEARRMKEGVTQKEENKKEYQKVRQLAKLNPKQKERYIMEGKLPPGQ
jgi:putative FmdB family regulatory protein